MGDPVRNKNKGSFYIETKFKQGKDPEYSIRLNLLVDKAKMESLSEPQVQAFLEGEMAKISPTPVSGIFYQQAVFHYSEPDALKDFDYGNILVEAHLPYCLHIPNDYELELTLPDGNTVLIIPRKIWTKRATEDENEPSDEVDIFGEDRIVYLKKSVLTSPNFPIHSEEGWEQAYKGRNIEKIKDQNGTFRYTRLYLQFDYEIPKNRLEGGKDTKVALDEVWQVALTAVNYLIDCYRFTTGQEYIQRLGSLSVNMTYFLDHNIGFYTSFPNIETAPINRTKKEIDHIEKMLESGEKPPVYRLLLLDAKCAFDNKRYVLAVAQSFQAFEIFLEDFLIEELKKRGDNEAQQSKYLDTNWRTKIRLKECLKELKGISLGEANQTLWDKWCTLYDTRNEIIHQGKEAKQTEVQNVLETNIKVIDWLTSLDGSK